MSKDMHDDGSTKGIITEQISATFVLDRVEPSACWDNAVVERFFGSLKHDWIFKVAQPTREHMKADVADYIKYYNLDRLHTANGGVSPIQFEMSYKKVSGFA